MRPPCTPFRPGFDRFRHPGAKTGTGGSAFFGVDHHDSGPFPVRSPAFFGAVLSAYTIWSASPHGLCAVGAFLSLSRLRRQLPRQREQKGRGAGRTQRPGAFLSLSRLRRQLPRQREQKGDAGAQELTWGIPDLQPAGGKRNTKETHGRRQEAASPAARKCAAGLVGDILLTIRDGREIRPCRPSRTAPSSP